MDKKQFIKLLRKYNRGEASKEEVNFIVSYYNLFKASLSGDPDFPDEVSKELLKKEIKEKVDRAILTPEPNKKKNVIFSRSRRIAAIILFLLLSASAVYLFDRGLWKGPSIAQSESPSTPENEIKPGGNKAVLTLSGGRQIILDETGVGSLAKEGSTDVVKEDSNLLSYNVDRAQHGASGKIEYNTITTPAGGTFKVALPDGSKVWLNASSSLRFPTAFAGAERRVEMTGEVYFEVAKDRKRPFKVNVNDMEVKVLGTHFNVNAYSDESEIRTTLEEGSVQVSYGNVEKKIRPGQQISLSKADSRMSVREVNVDEFLAWKNGVFYFDNTNIRNIMRQVARWYDVNVEYLTGDLEDKNYSGVVSRYGDVKELLNRFELTGTIRFSLKGKRIVVEN